MRSKECCAVVALLRSCSCSTEHFRFLSYHVPPSLLRLVPPSLLGRFRSLTSSHLPPSFFDLKVERINL
nr:MAG TPA: hypothetical protein [Caudoviricetes sp.]